MSSAEEGQMEEKPVEESSTTEAPVDEVPVDEAPVDEVPVDEAPVDEVPVDEAPVDEAPVDEAPVDEAPVDEAPVDEAPVDEAPVDEPPVDEAPVDEPVADATPAGEASADAVVAEGEAPAAEEVAAEEPESIMAAPSPDHRWYVVQAYSGYENRVQQSLGERVRAQGMEELITNIQVPSEEVLEIKGGKKRKSNRKFFPGYVLVQAKMTDEVWHLIKDIPKVTGFVGGRHPASLEPEEVQDLLYQMETGVRPPRATVDFTVGDKVRIIEGPFSGFVANVDEVIESQSKLKVMVTIFGRSTPVELGFLQVEAA